MKKLLFVAALTAAVLGSGLLVQAADKPADAGKDAKAKFRPFNGTIKAVDKAAKTIALEGEKAQTFQITSESKIRKDGKPATLADVAAGDHVGGRARETADGKWDALTVNVSKVAARADKPKTTDKK